MAPTLLNPSHWLALLHDLPRPGALAVLAVALSMLGLGLLGFAHYVRLAAAVAGFLAGWWLAGLMQVQGWTVALPASLVSLGLLWLPARLVGKAIIAVVLGCAAGTLVTEVFEMELFWTVFAVGCLVGLAAVWLAPRFTVALFCATCGALAAIASLGAVIRASAGPLAPAAYLTYPLAFGVAGALLVVLAFVVQVRALMRSEP